MINTKYFSNPNVNNGEPLPMYEMGKIYPGHPLFKIAKNTPTYLEVLKAQEQEKIALYLTADQSK